MSRVLGGGPPEAPQPLQGNDSRGLGPLSPEKGTSGPPDDREDLGAWCNKTDDAGVADFIAGFDAEIVDGAVVRAVYTCAATFPSRAASPHPTSAIGGRVLKRRDRRPRT